MVVKEDGSKWACQSCLKGHRVSACTHTDRELTLVPKKGRPVTQCQHCRLERKKRSAHVKCDCGETDKPHHPREKCIHLREAEERAKAGQSNDHASEKDPAYLAAVAEEQGCCCHHGGKCTCAILMKEAEDGSGAPHGPAVKPRLEKTISDGAITVFTNGHHKPVHRKNHAAHECGMPYKMPMPRSGPDQDLSKAARRSFDNLALESSMTYQLSPSALQTDATFPTGRRKSKSEQPSPKIPPLGTCSGLGDSKLTSVDFSDLTQSQTNSSMQSAISSNYYQQFEPMSGLTESSFDPWSALPSSESAGMPSNNPFGVWPTPIDHASVSQPALTAASSGTQSEIDEIPPMDDVYGYPMPSIQEDLDNDMIRFASNSSPQLNRRSLPPGFFGNTDFGTTGPTSDWQTSLGDLIGSERSKVQNTPPACFDDFWQTSAVQPSSSLPQRAPGSFSFSPRPQSRSVGSSNMPPNDEIIRQLFPDLELNNGVFGSTGSPQMGADKTMGGMSKSNITSAPMDFGPMDETIGFTTQAWSDGSMSVPNDTFTSSYDLDQDFTDPQFPPDWAQ